MANPLIYPMKIMGISQSYKGSFSHAKYYKGKPNDYPIDDAGKDTGKDGIYCPCNKMKVKRIYGVGGSGTNTIWLESTRKVRFADGTADYCTLMIVHPEDSALKGVKVGQKFKRKQKITTEGKDGHATGNHVHISVGKGKFKGNGWVKNNLGGWPLTCSKGPVKPEKAFWIDKSFTKIKNSAGLSFKDLPEDSKDTKKQKPEYFQKCKNDISTLSKGFESIGLTLSFADRAEIAQINGIKGYKGTSVQNGKMLKLLKKGKLRRA